ncbi:hypothetical protein [Nonomuraea sp. NPDC049504]|uniref:hypothetical protein n=1 Tax=Nonomuraea sp. NPDC049504 TaxID=3154729 RepID=UPI0034202703
MRSVPSTTNPAFSATRRDGETVAWDTHLGDGSVSEDDSVEEILRAYLYQGAAVAYRYAGAGLLPSDARSLTEEAGT